MIIHLSIYNPYIIQLYVYSRMIQLDPEVKVGDSEMSGVLARRLASVQCLGEELEVVLLSMDGHVP